MNVLIAEAGYWDMMVELVRQAANLAAEIATEYVGYTVVGHVEPDPSDPEFGQREADEFNAKVDAGLKLMDDLTRVKRSINDARTIYDTEGEDAAVAYLRACLLDGAILACEDDSYMPYDRTMDMSLCRLICEILAGGDRPDGKTLSYLRQLSYKYDL